MGKASSNNVRYNKIAGQISVVVVIEADEDALSGQALVPFPPDDALAVDRTSLAGATRAGKRELPTVLGADPAADADQRLLLSRRAAVAVARGRRPRREATGRAALRRGLVLRKARYRG